MPFHSPPKTVQKKNEPDITDSEPWWQFSGTTWCLIVGLLAFNIGIFLSPKVLDALLGFVGRTLDFRLWHWYYFLFLLVVLAFSVRWFMIYRAFQDDFDTPDNPDEMKAFVWLTGTITAIFLTYVFLEQTLALKYLLLQLWKFMAVGAFSWHALLFFFLIIGSIGAVVALTKFWVETLQYE